MVSGALCASAHCRARSAVLSAKHVMQRAWYFYHFSLTMAFGWFDPDCGLALK
jgi:hypothetical protein